MTTVVYQERQDVLGLALDLHMYCTGSGPDLSPEDRAFVVRYLKMRLGDWSSNGDEAEPFDTAVRLVLVTALAEDRKRSEFDAKWVKA